MSKYELSVFRRVTFLLSKIVFVENLWRIPIRPKKYFFDERKNPPEIEIQSLQPASINFYIAIFLRTFVYAN